MGGRFKSWHVIENGVGALRRDGSDFAGEVLDSYSEMRLLDYGFAYHRDTACKQDDTTWFLLEKH